MDVIESYKRTRQKLFEAAGIQPESAVVATKGPVKQIHYLKAGSGRPVILLHGGGSHSSEWINILPPLAAHYQLFVVDRPGCGLSDTFNYRGVSVRAHAIEFIKAFMEAVELQQAQFIGHSMGGYFSICFAMYYPERVEKLVLAGAPAGMNHWIPPMLRLLGIKGLNSLLMNTIAKPSIKNVLNIYTEILVADVKNLSDDFLRHMYYSELLPGRFKSFTTLLENVLTLKGWNDSYYVGDKLQQLSVPVRFIWGDKDAFEKPDTGMQKAKGIKDCKFEVVENAGHCVWLDQPEQSIKAILSMLDSASPIRN